MKDILFPYARAYLADYVVSHRDTSEVCGCLNEVRAIAGAELTDAQVIEQLIRWIDEDRKSRRLKRCKA